MLQDSALPKLRKDDKVQHYGQILTPVYRKPNGGKNFIIKIAWSIIINKNLKWNCHVDYITAKASKKLYVLRLLKGSGVQEQDMVKVFRSSVRDRFQYMPCRCGKTFPTVK